MASEKQFTYYCLFDPTTGEKLGGYVEGVHANIPTDAIRVSKNDFILYASDSNWRYDWDNKAPIYVPPIANINLKVLRKECLERSNKITEREITAGVSVVIPRLGRARLDTDRDTQLTFLAIANNASDNIDKKFSIRMYLEGEMEKSTHEVDFEAIRVISNAMTDHIMGAKARGSERRDYICDVTRSVEELLTYYSNLK